MQADSARTNQIIDGRWVAVGTNKPHTIQLDYSRPFQGKPSYRFELKQEDNTLEGYAQGETKGRAELCYCYAVANDFRNYPATEYLNAQKMKTVYHYGKGSCPARHHPELYILCLHSCGLWIRKCLPIFAQWHGMPSRTLVSDPDGKVMRLSVEDSFEVGKEDDFQEEYSP